MPAARDEDVRGLPELRCARSWLGLAVGVLILAGLFSLVVVIGRMPPFDRLVSDPLLFKRGLVVHVNLALVAWFYSFVAALLFLVPGRHAPGWLARHSAQLAGAGIALLLLASALPGARPVLSNYIPMIDHPLFATGQLLFAAGVLASFLGRRLLPRPTSRPAFFEIPGCARVGIRATALGLVLAALTFATSLWRITPGIALDAHYELLMWGGGHVLQLTCSVAMVTAWLILLHSALGRAPLSRSTATLLFFAMMAPWLFSPFLALAGTWTSAYRDGFTSLMRWSIFPVVCLFLVACLRLLAQERRAGRIDWSALADPRISGFLASAALTLLGFLLGAAIRGSNTMVPAHYHASIGAVTAAFMTLAYVMLSKFGLAAPTPRLRRAAAWQPVLYSAGQIVFASGFALAGAFGMTRKTYGAEQAQRGLGESVGLGVMGIGGLVAVLGGVLFLVVVVAIWRRGSDGRQEDDNSETKGTRRYRWERETRMASIRFRS